MTTTATSTTTRCTLPLPIGASENERITVDITDREDDVRGRFTEIAIISGSEGIGYSSLVKAFIGVRDGELLDSDGGTIAFSSLATAVAHMMLSGFSAAYLALPEPLATRWDALRRKDPHSAHVIGGGIGSGGVLQGGAWTPRGLWRTADAAAHVLTHMLPNGSGLRLALAASRPFDPVYGRYLDGAREYSDGSGAEDTL